MSRFSNYQRATIVLDTISGFIALVMASVSISERAPRAQSWAFTINNYTDEIIEHLCNNFDEHFNYLVFGKEVGENGTPHLQGTVVFSNRVRFARAKSLIHDTAHIEVCRNLRRSVEYCKKDGNVTEMGELKAKTQGKRSDLDMFKEDVEAGVVKTNGDAMELHSDVFAKYKNFCVGYIEHVFTKSLKNIDTFPLYVWQARLYSDLQHEADKRKVIFIVDEIGNSGKSWFARYCYEHLSRNVQILPPGKHADMCYALEATTDCLFIDAPRSKQEFLPYSFFEQVKNGWVFSAKYDSHVKRMNPCHMIVLMNEFPDMTKLSRDRYDVRDISGQSVPV